MCTLGPVSLAPSTSARPALLSKVYAQKVAAGDQEAIAILRGISPVAWQHINLFGTVEFDETTDKVDIDALAARFADPDYWSKALREMQEVPLG